MTGADHHDDVEDLDGWGECSERDDGESCCSYSCGLDEGSRYPSPDGNIFNCSTSRQPL